MRVITFSTKFPKYHPRAGEKTMFVEKIWKGLKTGNHRDGQYTVWSKHPRLMKAGYWQLPHVWRDIMNDKNFAPKYHTIRAGNRWKEGDFFSPRIWSGKPYASKQIEFAPPIEIKKIWNFEIRKIQSGIFAMYQGFINGNWMDIEEIGLIKNDGLTYQDFCDWFKLDSAKKDIHFDGQIICWNEEIVY